MPTRHGRHEHQPHRLQVRAVKKLIDCTVGLGHTVIETPHRLWRAGRLRQPLELPAADCHLQAQITRIPCRCSVEFLKLPRSTPNSWSESLGNVHVLLEARIAREGAKSADLSIALTHLNRSRTQVEAELARAAAGTPKREGRTGARITEYRV